MNFNTTLNGIDLPEQLKASSLFSQDFSDIFKPFGKASLEPVEAVGTELKDLFDDEASTLEEMSERFLAKFESAMGPLDSPPSSSSPVPQFSPAQKQPIRELSDPLPLAPEDGGGAHDPAVCNHAGCAACNSTSQDRRSKTQPAPFEFNTFNPNVDERGGRFGKWSQPGGKGTPSNITYSFANNFDLPGLNQTEAKSLFADALEVWSDYSPLNFQEIKDPGNGNAVDIRVEGKYIDGRSNVLGRAFSPVSGDITFDSGDTWNTSLFLETAVHEIGHSLGLTHENGVDAIMNSSIKNRFRGQPNAFLLQDDINGIRSLYGSGKGSVRTLAGTSPGPSPNPIPPEPTPDPTPPNPIPPEPTPDPTPPNPNPPEPTPDPTPPNPNKNLVINGGFENSSVGANRFGVFEQVQGWKTLRGPGIQIDKRRNLFGAASEGSAWAELDSVGNSLVQQTVDTVTGQDYTLSFDYSPRPGSAARTNRIAVYWNGKAVAKIGRQGGTQNQWETFSFDVKGKNGRNRSQLRLQAQGKSDNVGGFIDNIVVQEAANVTADAYSLGSAEAKQDPFVDHNCLAQGFEVTTDSTLGGNGLNPVETL